MIVIVINVNHKFNTTCLYTICELLQLEHVITSAYNKELVLYIRMVINTILCIATPTCFNVYTIVIFMQGGFAKCYELIDKENNVIYAGKIVAKELLIKPHQKDKVFH